jgi:antitoxin component YwqK of YwqJK toxin-antitoxin module
VPLPNNVIKLTLRELWLVAQVQRTASAMKLKVILCACVLMPVFTSADYAECILENMKGVGSDVAAEEIKKACEQASSHSKEALPTSIESSSETEALLTSAQSNDALVDKPLWEVATPEGLEASFGEEDFSSDCIFHSFHCIPNQFIEWEELAISEYVKNEPALFFDGELFRVRRDSSSEVYSGEMKSYFRSGKLASKVLFKNGVLHGAFSRWYPNGAIAVTGSYKRGDLSGAYREFFENGRPRAQTSMRNGLPSKEIKLWYKSGGLRSHFKLTASGKFNSLGRAWYEDGSIAFEGRFSRGRVFGTHKIFHLNGASALEYELVLGFEQRCYDESPDIIREQNRLRYGRGKSDSFKEHFAPNLSCERLSSKTIAKSATARDNKGATLWESNNEGLFVSRFDGEMVAVKVE